VEWRCGPGRLHQCCIAQSEAAGNTPGLQAAETASTFHTDITSTVVFSTCYAHLLTSTISFSDKTLTHASECKSKPKLFLELHLESAPIKDCNEFFSYHLHFDCFVCCWCTPDLSNTRFIAAHIYVSLADPRFSKGEGRLGCLALSPHRSPCRWG